MATIPPSPSRRSLLVTSAAASALSLLPAQLAAASDGNTIRPFSINVPEEQLVDLRRRIAATRWPDQETVNDRSQGVQLAKLQELVRYWGTDYDWRKAEAKLNALPQFMTTIDDVDIHFIHVRSRHPNAMPLIMTHGWPGSVFELLKTVGPLTDPTAHGGRAEDAFDLVMPSMPGLRLLRQAKGHGLESRPHRPRLGGADEAPRVHPLRRPGRRLGRPRLQRDGAPGAGRIARHPHQLAGDGTARGGRGARRRRACAGGTLREGTRGVRLARHVLQEVQGLRRNDGHAAADDRLRLDGLSSGACGLDVRLQQRRARAPAHQRRCAGRRHAVLADEQRDLVSAAVLGDHAAKAFFSRPRRRPPRSRSRWPSRYFRRRSIEPRRHGPGAPIAT